MTLCNNCGRGKANQLLNFLEGRRIKVDQQRKSYDFEIRLLSRNPHVEFLCDGRQSIAYS